MSETAPHQKLNELLVPPLDERRKLRIGGRIGKFGLKLFDRVPYAPYELPASQEGSDSEENRDTMKRLLLMTPDHIKSLPDGTVLTSIDGQTVTKGTDPIDFDTRGGFAAFGIPERVKKNTPMNVFTAKRAGQK